MRHFITSKWQTQQMSRNIFCCLWLRFKGPAQGISCGVGLERSCLIHWVSSVSYYESCLLTHHCVCFVWAKQKLSVDLQYSSRLPKLGSHLTSWVSVDVSLVCCACLDKLLSRHACVCSLWIWVEIHANLIYPYVEEYNPFIHPFILSRRIDW